MKVSPTDPVTGHSKKRKRRVKNPHVQTQAVLVGEAKDLLLPLPNPAQVPSDLKADLGHRAPVEPSGASPGLQAPYGPEASLVDAKARGPAVVMAGKLPLEDDAYRVLDPETWRRYLLRDPHYNSLINYITKQELPSDLAERERLKKQAGFYFVDDGLLYYRQATKIGEQHVLEAPEEYRRDIIRLYHDHPTGGHRAAPTVRKMITRSFRWSTLRADVKRYVHSCLKCFLSRSSAQRGGAIKNQGLLATLGSEVDKFVVIHIDFVGPLRANTTRESVHIHN